MKNIYLLIQEQETRKLLVGYLIYILWLTYSEILVFVCIYAHLIYYYTENNN